MDREQADGRRQLAVGEKMTIAALFLLPWQTRFILAAPTLNGGAWEYGTVSAYVIELIVLAAVCGFGWKRVAGAVHQVRTPLALFWLVLVISALCGDAPGTSLGFLFHLVCAGLLGLCVYTARSRERLATAFVAGLVPAALLGWWQTLSGASPAFKWLGLAAHEAATPGVAVIETTDRLLRAYGPFSHPNVFGGFLVIGILACVWLETRLGQRGSPTLAAALFGATLVITFSRSAMLGLAAAVMLLIFFVLKDKRVMRSWVAAGAILGLLVAGVWFRMPLLSRTDATNRLEMTSLADRGNQYKKFASVYARAPIFGRGPGAFTAGLAADIPGYKPYEYQPIHNVPLLVLGEIGLAGVLALFWLLKRSISAMGSDGPNRRMTWVILAALLPAFFLDHYLWSSWQGLALFACLAAFLMKQKPLLTGEKPIATLLP